MRQLFVLKRKVSKIEENYEIRQVFEGIKVN